ncbi:hypothetical protein [Coxiella endosymbiont of Rhipicephalus microplus]
MALNICDELMQLRKQKK